MTQHEESEVLSLLKPTPPSPQKVDTKLKHILKSAKQRGKMFNLTHFYVYNLLNQQYCAYSGEVLSNSNTTFERIDNDKGYVIGNVIPVVERLNQLRDDNTIDEMIDHRDWLVGELTTLKSTPPIKPRFNYTNFKTLEDAHEALKVVCDSYISSVVNWNNTCNKLRSKIVDCDLVIDGMKKYHNLSPQQKRNLSLGVPINISMDKIKDVVYDVPTLNKYGFTNYEIFSS